MIVLNVTYKCKPGMRDEYYNAIKEAGIDTSSRDEEGCQKYEYFFSAEDADEILLIEKWKDADAITFHKAQDHFSRLGEIKEKYVNETIIDKFEA